MTNRKILCVDWILLSAIITQLLLGVLFVASTSSPLSERITGNPHYLFYFHIASLLCSLFVAGILFKYWSSNYITKHIHWLLIASVLLITLTLLPYKDVSLDGEIRWISFSTGTVYVFPLAMFLLLICFSHYLDKYYNHNLIRSAPSAKLFISSIIVTFLFWMQLDISSWFLLVCVTLLMCMLAGWYKYTLMSVIVLFTALFTMLALTPYMTARALEFLRPFDNLSYSGYLLSKSLIAIGGGNLLGTGYGEGIIKSLIPNVHENYIYSSIIEETGIAGGLLVLSTSIVIFVRSLYISQRLLAEQRIFESLLVMALTAWLSLTTLFHIGGTLGLSPIVSKPYPLLSYGGVYLCTFLTSLAIILKIGSSLQLDYLGEADVGSVPVYKNITFWFFISIFAVIFYESISKALFDKRLDSMYVIHTKSANKYVSDEKFGQLKNSRAQIVDRFGKILAKDIIRYDVWLDPQKINIKSREIVAISALLEMRKSKILKRIEYGKSIKSRFIYLKNNIDYDTGHQINNLNIKGIGLTAISRRFYPSGEATSHLVGIAGRDNNGLEGIELRFDKILSNPNNKELQLSIDKRIQDIAYKALKSSSFENKAKRSSAIVVDTTTSEILALAVYPSFNPNDQSILGSKRASFWNPVISMQFEPSKLMTPFTLLARNITPDHLDNSFVDTNPGYFMIGKHKIQDPINYGNINYAELLKTDSRVGMTKLAFDMPKQMLQQFLADIGFGSKSGIELAGESSGYIGSPEKLSNIEKATKSFGYGVSVTPIQMVNAYMVLANDGIASSATLIKGKKSNRKKLIQVSPAIANNIRYLMQRNYISSVKQQVPPALLVSGKSALTQLNIMGQYVDRYIGTFVGITPIENPKILIFILVEEPDIHQHSANIIAESIFNRILNKSHELIDDYQY